MYLLVCALPVANLSPLEREDAGAAFAQFAAGWGRWDSVTPTPGSAAGAASQHAGAPPDRAEAAPAREARISSPTPPAQS